MKLISTLIVPGIGFRQKQPRNRAGIAALVCAAVLAIGVSSSQAAVILLGNTYAPAGANYTITALSGINAANPFGTGGAAAQVNQNFEFPGDIGVSYPNGAALTNFGLGLYSSGGATASTGLNIQYKAPVAASSASVRLEDFDVRADAAGNPSAFNPQKVEPSFLILGPGNAIIASATPADLRPNMHLVAGTNDQWDVDIGGLMTTLGKPANTSISGIVLYSDAVNGEKVPSDPYLLVSVANPGVPEVSSFLPLVGMFGMVFGGHRYRRRSNSAAA